MKPFIWVTILGIFFINNHVSADALNDAISKLRRAGCELKDNSKNLRDYSKKRAYNLQSAVDKLRSEKDQDKCANYLYYELYKHNRKFNDYYRSMKGINDKAWNICNGSYAPVWSIRNNPDIYRRKVERFQDLVNSFNNTLDQINRSDKKIKDAMTYVKYSCR